MTSQTPTPAEFADAEPAPAEPADARDAREALARLSFYAADEIAGARIARLGGLTNRVFSVRGPKGHHILRLPGAGTQDYIDRRVERIAAEAAARARVSPELLVAGDDGVMIALAVEGCRTMTPAGFAADPGAVARAGRVLRQLHDSGAVFDFTFDLFGMVDRYLTLLKARDVAFPDGYFDVLDSASRVRAALAAHPLPRAPCHCDPLCENFLDTGERMWLVDWEYSGMNDPAWDLGDLAVEAELDAAGERILVESYFGRAPDAYELGRVVIYKAMCDLLWTLSGLIQHADGNPADDFRAYAERRFRRCRSLMGAKAFARHLADVAAGPGL